MKKREDSGVFRERDYLLESVGSDISDDGEDTKEWSDKKRTLRKLFCCSKKRDKNAEKPNILLYVTIIAVIVGLLLGYVVSRVNPGDPWITLIGFPGDLFIRTLKLLVVPMMFASLTGAMASVTDFNNSKVGRYAFSWFLSTTIIAGTFGIIWVNVFSPWRLLKNEDMDPLPGESSSSQEPRTPLDSVLELLLQLFPDNLVNAALDMNMLGIIMFSSVFGLVLANMEDKGRPLLEIIESFNIAIQKMVGLVILVSPLGVFSLVCYHMGKAGNFWGVMEGMGMLIACRFVGIIFHGLVMLPLLHFILTRNNPYSVLMRGSEIWAMAFGTSSSAATLPVTLRVVEEKLGVAPVTARFVCTTGATINMDAAAIAYSITAICMSNVVGIQLNVVGMIVVVLTSTLVSVGAAALPSAGLINYIAVMSAIGLPLDKVVPILAPILSVDWLEDRFMTMVNVEGDVFGATTIQHFLDGDSSKVLI